MKCIQVKWNTNSLFFPILMAIAYPLRYISTNQLPKNYSPLFFTFVMFSAQVTGGIFELIVKANTKNTSPKYIDDNNNNKCKFNFGILILFVSSCLDLIEFTILNYMITEANPTSPIIFRMAQILFIILFSWLILKHYLYRHHVISLIGIIVLFLTLAVINYINNSNTFKEICFYLLSYCLNSLRIVIIKLVMDKWFVSAYKSLFFAGLFGNILILLFISICTILKIEKFSFNLIIFPIKECVTNYKYCLFLIAIFIFGMLFNIFNILTNQKLSSIHYGIGDVLICLILLIYLSDHHHQILYGVILILILVFCMIYTEILVLSCFGMENDTATKIFERALIENKEDNRLTQKEIINLGNL